VYYLTRPFNNLQATFKQANRQEKNAKTHILNVYFAEQYNGSRPKEVNRQNQHTLVAYIKKFNQ
jgi:hypothetical protein